METMPLVLLAGRDRRMPVLPEEGRDLHVLRGYKAMLIEIGGRPLVEHIVERMRSTGAFDPVFLAGPASVYGGVPGVRVVDTDGDFGENVRAGLEAVAAAGLTGRQVAVMTSDVLPEPEDLAEVLDDLERHQPCDFWVAECRAELKEELGQSAWKPKYLVRPEGGGEPVPTVPGHLFIADPAIVRVDLLCRLFGLAYRTRNRPQAYRRAVIVRDVVWTLLVKDLKRLFTLQVPDFLWGMLWNGVVLARRMVTVGVTQREMEDRVRRIFIRTSHRRRHPERRGRVMLARGLSLGRDIDTEEEAWELLGEAGAAEKA